MLKASNFQVPSHLDLEGQRDHLISILETYARKSGAHITLVFDSREPLPVTTRPSSRLVVKFSPPGKEADDVIKEWIRRAKNTRSLTVVSSDNAIRFTARDHGARSLTSNEFHNLIQHSLHSPAEPRKPPEREKFEPSEMDENELNYWKRLFEEDQEQEAEDE